MKNLALGALLCCMFFMACDKKGKQTFTPTTETPNSFIINGTGDFKVQQDNSTVMALAIEHKQGEQEKVTLSGVDLPKGIHFGFEPASGTPTYGSVLTVSASHDAPLGVHTVKLKGEGSRGSVKEYTMTMEVTKGVGCDKILPGTYSVTKDCNLDGMTTVCTVENLSAANTVRFTRFPFDVHYYRLDATYDCEKRTITLPETTFGWGEIARGSGTFTNNKMELTMEIKLMNSSQYHLCKFTLYKW